MEPKTSLLKIKISNVFPASILEYTGQRSKVLSGSCLTLDLVAGACLGRKRSLLLIESGIAKRGCALLEVYGLTEFNKLFLSP